jgi:hypothetical protein
LKTKLQDAAVKFARKEMKKSLIAALVFASASMVGSAAFAQTTTGSTSTVVGNTPQTITLSSGAGFFGDTFAANNMGSTFSDKFNFNVASGTSTSPTMSSLDAIISSISRSADTGLAITGLSLYNSTGTLVSSGNMLQSGTVDVWTISSSNLAAGNYYLQVSGNLVGNTAAAFGGAISMAAPVPEPETYGMMLAGLGVLGFLARRRKAAKQA